MMFLFLYLSAVKISPKDAKQRGKKKATCDGTLGLVWIFFFNFLSFITPHSISVTHHSSLITHHSSLKTPHPVWHHQSFIITQYFSTICGTHPLTQSAFLFIHVNTYFNQAHHDPYFHTFPKSTIQPKGYLVIY